MGCKGIHCDGCRSGPGLGLAVIVALVLLIAGSAGTVASAAVHAADVILPIILITVGSLAGLGVALAVVAVVVSGRRAARPAPYWAQVTHNPARARRPAATGSAARGLPGARPANELHIHLHGARAEDIAALRQAIDQHR
jgi:hypothetical protein